MTTPQVDKLPAIWKIKGPDWLCGFDSITFIVTPFKDAKNRNYFEIIGQGHEHLINKDIVQAMFGPEAEKRLPEVLISGKAYDKLGKPILDQNGNHLDKEYWDWYKIRQLTAGSTVYGRKGKLADQNIVMIWQSVPNWMEMLLVAIDKLQVDQNTILTVGFSNQFLLKDLIEFQKKSKVLNLTVGLLKEYHVANGSYKRWLRNLS